MSKGIVGDAIPPDTSDFGDDVAWNDHKIKFFAAHCRAKNVLDMGCVQHNAENRRSRFWAHRAIRQVAATVLGLDIYEPGVDALRLAGFDVVCADAQNFSLARSFDVIVAGDLIEHLHNPGSFLACCRQHMNASSKLLISTPNPWYWKNCLMAVRGRGVIVNPEHVGWYCPATLKQLLARYDFAIDEVHFGSRYFPDRVLPLPKQLKHTTLHVVARLA